MKSFGVKPWMQPVSHSYFALGENVGNAFSDGKKLK